MSLLDALLLDPQRINIWIAIRSDLSEGSGTQQDPYSGTTLAQFDSVMRNKVGVNTCVHLGPGIFQTAGFYEGISPTSGWQVKPGLRLVGSGVDVTILKRVNDVPANKIGYAVGHELTKTGPSPNLVDFAEITELSIDANFAGLSNLGTAASAIRMMGNHARAVRVKITNWGNKSSTIPSFGIALLTGNTNSGIVASDVVAVTNCGIDSCIALTPSPTSSGTVVALQVGAKEDPGTVEALGVAPYLRLIFPHSERVICSPDQ